MKTCILNNLSNQSKAIKNKLEKCFTKKMWLNCNRNNLKILESKGNFSNNFRKINTR